MFKNLTITFLIIACLVFSTENHARAADQTVYEIKVAHYIPATIAVSRVRIQFFDELVKRSKGRFRVKHFWSGSLAGAKETPDSLKINIAQAGSVGFGYRPELFKLIRAADLPFISKTGDALSRATTEMVMEHSAMRREMESAGVKILCLEFAERSPIISRKPARGIDEMNGWKIRAYGQFGAIIKSWKATPIALPFSDIPEALERGVIDASTAVYFTSYYGLKLHEIVNYSIDTGERFTTLIGMAMSLKFYNSLPEDLKTVIDDMAATSWKYWAEKYAEEVRANAKHLAATDMQFISWGPEQVKQAKNKCLPAAEKLYFTEMQERGIEKEARDIYRNISLKARKYDSESILPYSFDLIKRYRQR